MKVLGAVLAGGRSSRFGSDKALAQLGGRPLMDHAIAALADACDEVIVVGRDHPGIRCVPDWPAPDHGPLGGLAGAMRGADGFDAVLSCAVDSVGLPGDLLARLAPPPAYVASQPVIGLWSVSSYAILDAMLSRKASHSMYSFAEAIGARPVHLDTPPANVNTPADLARQEQLHGF